MHIPVLINPTTFSRRSGGEARRRYVQRFRSPLDQQRHTGAIHGGHRVLCQVGASRGGATFSIRVCVHPPPPGGAPLSMTGSPFCYR